MVPSESAPRVLSNEWSCRYVSTILNFLGNFNVSPFVTSPSVLKELKVLMHFMDWHLNIYNSHLPEHLVICT
jgi:hypothetical protein